jgi:hypothetical protein
MCRMPGTGNGSGQWITVGEAKYELIYSMLSLEKIETQFGSVVEMQAMITDAEGQVKLDRPVVKLLIDIIHAGLLHEFEDNDTARRVLATGIRPADLDTIVTAFTLAFTDAFGELGERVMAGETSGPVTVRPMARPNRAARRSASPSPVGTTSPQLSSKDRKRSGKK